MKNKLLTQAVKSMSAVLLAAVTLTNVPGCVNAGAVKSTEPVYPKMAQYPGEDENGWDKWNSSRRNQLSAPEGYCDSLWSFYGDSSRTYLSGTQENRAYSPVSLYMALSMLAECTSGESRSQILSLMNAPDIETLRTQAGQVWNANYCDDGAIKSVLANSVWLSDSLETNSGTIGTLAKSYYASVHSGEFGSDEMTQAFRVMLLHPVPGEFVAARYRKALLVEVEPTERVQHELRNDGRSLVAAASLVDKPGNVRVPVGFESAVKNIRAYFKVGVFQPSRLNEHLVNFALAELLVAVPDSQPVLDYSRPEVQFAALLICKIVQSKAVFSWL